MGGFVASCSGSVDRVFVMGTFWLTGNYVCLLFVADQDGTILPPETVVPAFSRVAGSPGRPVGELPECTQVAKLAYDPTLQLVTFLKHLPIYY